MRLIVLDTNVVVSAAIKPVSIPHTIIHSFVLENKVQLVLSTEVIAEYREVCTRSKFARYDFPPEWLEVMIDGGLLLSDLRPWPISLPDRDDGKFLALAKASGAWQITGNAKHYPVEARDGVTVCTPQDYLAHLIMKSD